MPRPLYNTTQLPKQLCDELGLSDPSNARNGDRRHGHNGRVSRKEQRKAERMNNKKTQPGKQGKLSQGSTRDGGRSVRSAPPLVAGKPSTMLKQTVKATAVTAPKSILKKRKEIFDESEVNLEEEEDGGGFSDLLDEDGSDEEDDDDESEEENESGNLQSSPPRRISRAVEEKLAKDDAEIASLEKKLGIKGKKGKLPQSFYDEGLADLLGDLDGSGSEDDSRKRKREEDEWLQRKRLKAQAAARKEKKQLKLDGDEESDDVSEDEDSYESDDGREDDEDDDEFGGFDDEDQDLEDSTPKVKKTRENPYVAPVAAPDAAARKYVPPSLRVQSSSEAESLNRLRRQVQGHLNKLSEANLISILRDVEKLYQDYPRHSVTSTLIDLLMGMVYDPSALQDTFIILHAGFIAAMYKVMGMDFGAEFIERIVKRFDEDYERKDNGISKEMINAISLLSHLYNFHVIGCSLVFDYIRLFLKEINEVNTELLLRIIKNSGPQLRQDDPSSLKDIILLIQPAISQIGEAPSQSARNS
ncbi:hypothetical protein ACJ72_04950 [Emergomyces africanus]|uniref:MIF4G domain-containing protein n=1 Tax=Emergomyces africanus TaxID=1955775 RepID=A0A1B7NVE1_9EURO|nr:hypothetical protein ACJ72_04950 [Emergomyces africanus]